MADERSDVADLDLVEARVHLAAAQYHNSLANGKLVPRPPGLPRSRPASAGARVCVRPGSAPLQRRGSQELRAEGAQDALGVLLGPWGNCCYQAPPGIITRTLHDIAEMLRVSATRRERRKNLVITCRQKFLPSTESMERLHASIIGRSLGRSFAHVLLMTKVLMGFREAVHTARLSNALQRRTGWLRSEKCQPDERCLEFHFQHWRHYTTSSLQQRAAEAEILRGRESVLEVFAQGRDELSRAVELLYDRSLVELLLVCMAAWRDALRLLSLEGYGYHLASTRERTPWWVEDLFLLPAEKAHLLLCLVCWAACCALQRQGRGLKDMEISLQEISQTVEGQRQQLRRGQALKERLEENSRRFVCRSLQQAERWLLNAVWQAWSRQSEATRRARQRLIRWLPERLKQQNALRGALEAWLSLAQEGRRKQQALRRGQRAIVRWQEDLRSWSLSSWRQTLQEQKEVALRRRQSERRRTWAERRCGECSLQLLRWTWDAWKLHLRHAQERARRVFSHVSLGDERQQWHLELQMLQLLSAWRYQAQEQRHLRQRLQSEQSSSRQLDQALQSAALALERCQEQPGPFHCRLLHEWRQLVVQRKTSAVRHGQRSRYVQLQEAKDQAMLLSSCLRQWQGQCQRSAAEWRTAQAVRQAQQQMHRKTLDALRRRQEGDACALQLLHFGAWRQEVLHSRIARAEKEKIITRTFGQLLLDDEMLRSRSFYEWRNALHHARHDALHRAAEQEAEERKKEAHEQKLQVMRQAFRSSSEALLGSAFLGWHNLARHRQQHLARRRQSEQRRERKDLELERFALLHCVCAWHVQALKCGSLRRKRSAGARIGLQALTLWQLRGVQGLTDPGRGAFQAQLLELWHQVALRGTEALRGRQQLRARNAQLCREKLIPALDVQRLLLLLGRWRLHCHLLHGRRAAGAMVEQRLAAEEQLWMSRLYDAWRLLRSEQLHLRAVGTSCQNAREVQLQLRWRMLHGMSQLQDLVDQGRLEALLLRWRVETSIRSTRRRLKERAFTGTMREVAREELELCQWVFSIFKAEATRERHQRELERTERQVQGARIVQRQMADGWKKALEALQAEQLRNLRAQLRSLCRAWLTGARALVNARGVRRRWASVLGHRQRQRALRRMCLHWRWVAGQERHDARLQRCRKYAENCTVQLRSAWLMQQTFRSWQHARAYEELFRILSDTQADLARAAEATALAETAAVAAQQRNQQVTVRVLPPKPAWAQVPHFVHPDPERDREAQFQAPVRSLQKDIQRHYAQRLQDLRNGTATSSARHCSFEVNIAQQGGPAEPTTREAWR